MSAPRFSVVIPTFDRATDLERTLRGYEAQVDAPTFEILVVDDGSRDNTSELLSGYRSERFTLRTVRQENAGPARARNQAIALAAGDRVLITGDDIEPDRRLLANHERHHAAEGNPHVAILGRVAWADELLPNATMRHVDGAGAQQFSFRFMHDGDFYDYRHFYTANVSIDRRFLLTEPGPFDAAFPFAAFEDAELALRLSRRGLRIRYRADPLGRHWHLYDAGSFFARQRRCGEMAAFLIEREPETAHLLGLRALDRARRRSWWIGKLGRGRLLELAGRLDEREAVAVSAAKSLDRAGDDAAFPLLYALFNYGYSAGLADRRWPAPVAARVRAALFARDVEPRVAEAARASPPTADERALGAPR